MVETVQLQNTICNNFSRITKKGLNESVQKSLKEMADAGIDLAQKPDIFEKSDSEHWTFDEDAVELKRVMLNILMGKTPHQKPDKHEFDGLSNFLSGYLGSENINQCIANVNRLKRGVHDPVIRQYLVKEVENIDSVLEVVISGKLMTKLNKLISVENSMNNRSYPLLGNAQEVAKYMRGSAEWVKNENKKLKGKCYESVFEILAKTLDSHIPQKQRVLFYKNSIELEPLKDYIEKYYNTSGIFHGIVDEDALFEPKEDKKDEYLVNYLYNKYYLPRLSPEVKTVCKKVYDEFLTYLFVENEQSAKYPKKIYKELCEWKKAFNGKFISPHVIDLDRYNLYYFEEKCQGYANSDTQSVYINSPNIGNFYNGLRHETYHLNDHNIGRKSLEACKISENKLYKEEFFNAGIPKYLINYAYTNFEEFKAVASEGDYSRYSKEFKQKLIENGFQKKLFTMQPVPVS